MTKRSLLWLTMTAALLLNGCATTIHDGPLCSPFPTIPPQKRGDNGASCDTFLTPSQRDLNATEWENEQAEWEARGCVEEITTSCFTAQLKSELEKLCTVATCTAAQSAQVAHAVNALARINAAALSLRK